jgi:predicted transcriptional regulator
MPEATTTNAKDRVEQLLKELPEDATLEDIQYHLYVLQVLENRLQEADKGDFVGHEEVRQRMAKWLIK